MRLGVGSPLANEVFKVVTIALPRFSSQSWISAHRICRVAVSGATQAGSRAVNANCSVGTIKLDFTVRHTAPRSRSRLLVVHNTACVTATALRKFLAYLLM
ncbi:hypothetical protein EVAR_50075_1 [Eumeta japonica]|uniref:Uncharacterized protein n=1 Tax=Eumeta variegata TaxID=151549 RepID=A0A4C1XKU3_EUMVA|nr:hypothetical protein EVAR_50075_1 [Eumeta japonica]